MPQENNTGPWSSPEIVARFSTSAGNEILHAFAEKELEKRTTHNLLDIGCGAGSNAIPLAKQGWFVHGLDLSEPMLDAAQKRAAENQLEQCVRFQRAAMDQLPVKDQSQDFIVAHGIWNLAGSSAEFRKAIREASRVAKPDAALFVYTFSRSTLAPDVRPVNGESFVFTEFSGRPQCFLTPEQLVYELQLAGFTPEPEFAITEYEPINGKKPAILEAIFRRQI